MTNGPGKSDRPVVPEKSPNNAGQPVAEGMEGRRLAEGNTLEQNASRTQCRQSASSALERVRQAARRDKKLRFTALLHHIYDVDRLCAAYGEIKRNAAAGVDGAECSFRNRMGGKGRLESRRWKTKSSSVRRSRY